MTWREILEASGVESYVGAVPQTVQWVRNLAVYQPVEKILVGMFAGLIAQFPVYYEALGIVLLFWALDFGIGVLRALADPEQELCPRKAAVGILKPFAIVLIWMFAVTVEYALAAMTGMILGGAALATVDLGGKLVVIACVAMVWEESVSFRGHGLYFYRRLRVFFDKVDGAIDRLSHRTNDEAGGDDQEAP